MRVPPVPKSAGEAGRRLWREANAEYRLSGADLAVLRHAVVMEDDLDRLLPWLRLGPIIKDDEGRPMVNPATVQYRLTSNAIGKLLAAIRVIGDEQPGEPGGRLQHRSGFRGPYGLKAVE